MERDRREHAVCQKGGMTAMLAAAAAAAPAQCLW